MPAPPRVTIVTVTWRSAATIGGFLASCPADLPVVVVDNASPDETPATVQAQRPDAQLIQNERNLGFGAGCNRGLEAVRTEFALLANPDSRLSAAAIAALVGAADLHPGHVLVAPILLDEAGGPIRSWDAAQRRRRLLRRDRGAEPWPEGRFCAAFASGACLLIRTEARLRFDETFFLFYEDDDLCARAGGVLIEPAARVAHAGGKSSPASLRTIWLKARCMAWSRLRFTALHGGGETVARREGWRRLAHHAGKALGHALTLQPRKLTSDLAGLAGTLAWMRGQR
jgi:GT2 family glycosyltransferase